MKKIITIFMSLIMLLSMCACTSTNNEPVSIDELFIPTYEDNAKIPILSEMPPDFSNRNNFDQYLESGMNSILIGEDYFLFGSEPFKKVMAWCEEENVDAYVRISKSQVYEVKQTDYNPKRYPTYFETYVKDHVNCKGALKLPAINAKTDKVDEEYLALHADCLELDFKDYPAIKGFAICDEPSWLQVLELRASYLPWFNENYGNGNYKFYNNFFTAQSALIGKDFDGEVKNYDDYCNFYIEEVLLKALDDGSKTYSHDIYPLGAKNGELVTHTGWLRANYNTATYCKKFGLTMGTYIQAYEGYADTVLPSSAAEIKFMLYTDIAFGSRQIMYFGYKETTDQGLIYPMMTQSGVPNPLYYYVQEGNREIAKIDHVLLDFDDWQGIYTFVGTGNKLPYTEHFDKIVPNKSLEEFAETTKLESLTGVTKFKSKYNSIVGEFKDSNGNTGFLLQNFDDRNLTRSNKVKITFENADGVLYYRKGEPIVQGLINHKFEIELDMCEGIFLIPLYKK